MSTIFTDRHIKTCQFSNLRLFWKSLLPFFRRTYALSVGLEIKTLRKSVFQCLDFYCPFLLSIWYESHFSNTVLIMECIELNWLCEHIKKIRSSKPAIPVLNWVKQQSLLVSIVKMHWLTKKRWKLYLYMHLWMQIGYPKDFSYIWSKCFVCKLFFSVEGLQEGLLCVYTVFILLFVITTIRYKLYLILV